MTVGSFDKSLIDAGIDQPNDSAGKDEEISDLQLFYEALFD